MKRDSTKTIYHSNIYLLISENQRLKRELEELTKDGQNLRQVLNQIYSAKAFRLIRIFWNIQQIFKLMTQALWREFKAIMFKKELLQKERDYDKKEYLDKILASKSFRPVRFYWNIKALIKVLIKSPLETTNIVTLWKEILSQERFYNKEEYLNKILSSKAFQIIRIYWNIKDSVIKGINNFSISIFPREQDKPSSGEVIISPPNYISVKEITPNIIPHPSRKLSIIMLYCKNHKFFKRTVESIFKNTRFPYEFIVIDNGADQRIKRKFAPYKKDKRVMFVENKKNLGFPKAVNQGLKICSGDYICLLNDDVVVPPDWATELINCLNLDSSFGIVGPQTSWAGQPEEVIPEAKKKRLIWSDKQIYQFAKKLKKEKYYQYQVMSHITGFCFLFRRELYDKYGPLDESFSPGSGEEVDFCWRAARYGWKSVNCKWVYVHHFGHITWDKLFGDTTELWKKNTEKVRKKWGKL